MARPLRQLRQLDLRLAEPAAGAVPPRWRDGATLNYLGAGITLRIDATHAAAALRGDVLHLPLPPCATPRQLQDAAEAWLRKQATAMTEAVLARLPPAGARWSLSFARRGPWAHVDDAGVLRVNWRLIEQPAQAIEAALARAVDACFAAGQTADLWGPSNG